MKKFFKIGGAGIGPTFNIKKFKFKRVILFVDSDIDAYNMMSLWSAAFLWAAPDIVRDGRLYRTQAPLYLINDKKNPYILSKHDYYDLFADKISKNYQLTDMKGHTLSTTELRKLIEVNNNYLDEVESLEKYLFADSEIFEFILSNGETNLIKNFKKKFPESDYDKESKILSTVYNGARFSVTLDEDFKSKCERLRHMITDDNHNQIYFNIVDNGVPIEGVKSLGSFFKMSSKYLPEIINRIKGVGELKPEVVWDTVLNPQKRRLIRLTCDDLEKELEIVRMLHGKDSGLRKEFMQDYRVNPDDLDT
jgi:DNA gyrase/topoisomerase IV subunit B